MVSCIFMEEIRLVELVLFLKMELGLEGSESSCLECKLYVRYM